MKFGESVFVSPAHFGGIVFTRITDKSSKLAVFQILTIGVSIAIVE